MYRIREQSDTNRSIETKDIPLRSIFNRSEDLGRSKNSNFEGSKFSKYLRERSVLSGIRDFSNESIKKSGNSIYTYYLDYKSLHNRRFQRNFKGNESHENEITSPLDLNSNKFLFKSANDRSEEQRVQKYLNLRNLNMSVELENSSSRQNLDEDYHINSYSIPKGLKILHRDNSKPKNVFRAKHSFEIDKNQMKHGMLGNR